jgi:hypothetical protein
MFLKIFKSLKMETESKLQIIGVIVSKNIEDVLLHPCSLKLIWKEIPSDKYNQNLLKDIKIEEDTKQGLFKQISSRIETRGWSAQVLNKNKVSLFSNQELELHKQVDPEFTNKFAQEDFVWTIQTMGGITLKNIVEGCYRLKALKYNFIHEIMTKLKLVEETEEGYIIEVMFKHEY